MGISVIIASQLYKQMRKLSNTILLCTIGNILYEICNTLFTTQVPQSNFHMAVIFKFDHVLFLAISLELVCALSQFDKGIIGWSQKGCFLTIFVTHSMIPQCDKQIITKWQ